MSTTPSPPKGHVFLSHSGADTHAAQQIAEILRHNGLEVWFDKDSFQPGASWMAEIEQSIECASAMIVYVGRLSVQSWVDREVRLGLVRNTQDPDGFRLIPVLGKGAEPASLPSFLQQHQWVDLRDPKHAAEQIHRLIETLKASSEQRAIPAEYWNTHSPFRSLQVFAPEDSWLFFGRDSEIDALLLRLHRAPVMGVVGNSGSGKSSLVRAGLIPALQRGRFGGQNDSVDSWRIAVVRPSQAPFDYLADVLPGQLALHSDVIEREKFIEHLRKTLPHNVHALRNALATLYNPSNEHSRILLVVDQFEELFTLTAEKDRHIRHAYIDLLLKASQRDGVHLVLVLRGDFYGYCLEHSELGQYFATNQYNVPRMNLEHIRKSINSRLALAMGQAEPGLIDALLADVGDEPGNLALLEHALSQLWNKRRSENTLTNDAYIEIGRLRGALGRHADDVLRQIHNQDEQRLVQRIFLELVQLGEGSQDTRRRVHKETLLALDRPERVEKVLVHLASSRLIHTSGSSGEDNFVEVSHEALIREWHVLREWIAENREDLRLERRLMESAGEWRTLNRDQGSLLLGARLVQAEEWLKKQSSPTELMLAFIQTSLKARTEAEWREREIQQRELDNARERSAQAERLQREAEARASVETQLREKEHSTAVRFRWFSFALCLLLLIAMGTAWFALNQQRIAESRALASQAEENFDHDQPAALDLAFRSWQRVHSSEAHFAVAHSFPQLLVIFQGHSETVWSAVFSPDGQRILTASLDKTARVWNAASGQLLVTLQGHSGGVRSAVFSPDGQRILTASDDKTARVWNAASGQLLATFQGHSALVNSAVFSPDGQRILTASNDKTARVWNAASGQLLATLQGHSGGVWSAVFSPDGQRILTASDDKTARVWNAASGHLLATLQGHSGFVMSAVFSPDGQRILTASGDKTARVWNAASGQLLVTLQGHSDLVMSAVFSPDGQRILTASNDQTARVWNTTSGQLLATLQGHSGFVRSAVFSPDGQRILTASNDRTARVWNTASGQLLAILQGHSGFVRSAVFSPDGQRILTASLDTTARVWNAASGHLLATLQGHSGLIWSAVFSPDGQRILTASDDKTARVWNAASGHLLAILQGHSGFVRSAVFSPDGQRILTASLDTTARVWNAASGQLLATFQGHSDLVMSAVFSPDGQRILTASSDKTARVFRIVTLSEIADLLTK